MIDKEDTTSDHETLFGLAGKVGLVLVLFTVGAVIFTWLTS